MGLGLGSCRGSSAEGEGSRVQESKERRPFGEGRREEGVENEDDVLDLEGREKMVEVEVQEREEVGSVEVFASEVKG